MIKMLCDCKDIRHLFSDHDSQGCTFHDCRCRYSREDLLEMNYMLKEDQRRKE